MGTVSRLSVSVLVADRIIPAKEKEPEKTEPRTAEELKALENMVASALGLNQTRGDKIEVTSMPFLGTEEAVESEGMAASRVYQLMPLVKYGLLLLGGALLYFLMIRPLMKTLKQDVTRHNKTVEQMEAEQAQRASRGSSTASSPKNSLQKLQNDVDADPAFGAHVLKNWIHERS